MTKGNVVVIGVSGSGKSTLINSVFGDDVLAQTGSGDEITKVMKIYEDADVPFRIIDTRGITYNRLKQHHAIKDIEKWWKKALKDRDENSNINMIWYCVEATSKKFHAENVGILAKIVEKWPGTPIVCVLTKSYSRLEDQDNINMVRRQIDKFNERHSKQQLNIEKIIPVVAKPFSVTAEFTVEQRGVLELMEYTNDRMPSACKAAEDAFEKFEWMQKQKMAQLLTGACTTSSAIVGAIPIPIADAVFLGGIETGLVKGICKIYGLSDAEIVEKLAVSIISTGTVGVAAKDAISLVKAVPVLNVAAEVINAIMAGVITALIGEATIIIMEKIGSGDLKPQDIEAASEIVSSTIKEKMGVFSTAIIKDVMAGKYSVKELAPMIMKLVFNQK